MKDFLSEDFLLENDTAVGLFHDYAKDMPIFDYHCHLPPMEIARNTQFANMTKIWLNGDHYKWRVLRTNGVDEKYCTGDAGDWEKFLKWAQTIPYAIGNPVYHWTHMELKNPFGIKGKVFNGDTAKEIWDDCNEKLATPAYRVHGLLNHFNVKGVCTTDDPIDDLAAHKEIRASGLSTKVLPAFRPDKALAIDTGQAWCDYIEKLSQASGVSITSYDTLLEALSQRHEYFHEQGCRIADHGMYLPFFEKPSVSRLKTVFKKGLARKPLTRQDVDMFMTALMLFFGKLHTGKGWTMQLHMGALRNNNTKMLKHIGPDTGYDAIADGPVAAPLAQFLDELNTNGALPKTILYVLNPGDNEVIATLAGCFQDGPVPGKIQFGSGWWFNDQKDGMIRQMTALSHMGLLSRFIGMLTDSRSFLSYPRHEYFRRILCNMIGTWVERGEAPRDMNLLGEMVRNISFNNARDYFGIQLD
ncbi:MAG: glucuronate isomerase [Spirochaetales bacterium]|nr:glucuronate isomerase [Spirochaetales bacterium]